MLAELMALKRENNQLRAALLDLGIWYPYTPSWTSSGTQPVLNNGTLTGSYTLIGATCLAQIVLTMGNTTTFGTGTYYFSLPVNMVGTMGGTWDANVPAVANYAGVVKAFSTSQIELVVNGVTYVTNTSPATWASTNTIRIAFNYRIN